MKLILNFKFTVLNSNGQVILIMLLIMSVALAVGLSVVQRSLTDVSTASKIDQSSRAFSAAEAGIEQSLSQPLASVIGVDLGNNATITSVDNKSIPGTGLAIEYPPINKEEIAEIWLAKPTDLSTPYSGSTLDIYWGDPQLGDSERPAIEITITYESNTTPSKYLTKKYFFDSIANRGNGFIPITCSNVGSIAYSDQSPAPKGKPFYCKTTLNLVADITNAAKLILLRARLLYVKSAHPLAISPVGTSLPAQGKVFTSIGASGETQRQIQLFQVDKIVPFYFDYALFAGDTVEKNAN